VRYLGGGADRFGRSGRSDSGRRRRCLGTISDRNPCRQRSNSPGQHGDTLGQCRDSAGQDYKPERSGLDSHNDTRQHYAVDDESE
jgi:hypothetical protein